MQEIELWALIPFGLMLASIAVLPLVAEHWWENNLHKLYVALGLALPASIYLIANFLYLKATKQWWLGIIIAVAMSVIVFYAFKLGFGISMP